MNENLSRASGRIVIFGCQDIPCDVRSLGLVINYFNRRLVTQGAFAYSQ